MGPIFSPAQTTLNVERYFSTDRALNVSLNRIIPNSG